MVLRYKATLEDGTVFEEHGEGNELHYTADEGSSTAPCISELMPDLEAAAQTVHWILKDCLCTAHHISDACWAAHAH